ncbi:MAG: GTPase Era [Ruminococcaceae bacterium]|nr:GTPase Era [Oscillospiraceae bacterium]
MKSGFVTVVGRPNAGKSTLINRFIGEKVAITSPKPQTTRTNLRAIVNGKGYQLIFIDTPGIHTPKTKLGEYMVESAVSGMESVDAIIYMLDAEASQKGIQQGDLEIVEKLKKIKNTPVFLAVNKVDAVPKESLLGMIKELTDLMEFKDVVPVSALKNDGVKILLNEVLKVIPEGPKYYDDDIITDSTVKEICTEIIREKILRFTNEEVPHGAGIEIIIFKEPMRPGATCHIEANIYCEKNSHKGILIGKEGAMLKRIGSSARFDMEKLIGSKVNLKLWVKVKDDWRNSPGMLKELGYNK